MPTGNKVAPASGPSGTRVAPPVAVPKHTKQGTRPGAAVKTRFFDTMRFAANATRELDHLKKKRGQGAISTIIFVAVVGLGSLGLGIALIVVGEERYIVDIMVFGGICIFMGIIAIILGAIFTVRPIYKERKRLARIAEMERVGQNAEYPTGAGVGTIPTAAYYSESQNRRPSLRADDVVAPPVTSSLTPQDGDLYKGRKNKENKLKPTVTPPPPLIAPLKDRPGTTSTELDTGEYRDMDDSFSEDGAKAGFCVGDHEADFKDGSAVGMAVSAERSTEFARASARANSGERSAEDTVEKGKETEQNSGGFGMQFVLPNEPSSSDEKPPGNTAASKDGDFRLKFDIPGAKDPQQTEEAEEDMPDPALLGKLLGESLTGAGSAATEDDTPDPKLLRKLLDTNPSDDLSSTNEKGLDQSGVEDPSKPGDVAAQEDDMPDPELLSKLLLGQNLGDEPSSAPELKLDLPGVEDPSKPGDASQEDDAPDPELLRKLLDQNHSDEPSSKTELKLDLPGVEDPSKMNDTPDDDTMPDAQLLSKLLDANLNDEPPAVEDGRDEDEGGASKEESAPGIVSQDGGDPTNQMFGNLTFGDKLGLNQEEENENEALRRMLDEVAFEKKLTELDEKPADNNAETEGQENAAENGSRKNDAGEKKGSASEGKETEDGKGIEGDELLLRREKTGGGDFMVALDIKGNS